MDTNLLIAYIALCVMAVVPIYCGSFAAVKWPKKSKQRTSPDSESESEDEAAVESLSAEDAYLFPIFGSAVLFSIYLVFQLLDKEYVNYLITVYFAFLGIASLTAAGAYIGKQTVPYKFETYKILISKKTKEIYKSSVTIIHLVSMLLSVVLTAYYVVTKNWIASNLLGLAFAFNGISMLSLDSFKTGMILLSGLFFYDIFWVFGTEVMVSVAKSFDAPIKVIWPKQWFPEDPNEGLQFAMLGLGDIVIPGIFVALCLRFDHNQYLEANPDARRHSPYPKPYFRNCFASYIAGLVTTVVVMHTFKAAQPALLYLSPACILSVLATGLVKGQLTNVFGYSSASEENEKEDEDRKKVKSTKKDSAAKLENSSEAEDEASGSSRPRRRKAATTRASTSGDDATGGEGSAFTGEEDYVEVCSKRRLEK